METKELESLHVLVVDDDSFLRDICSTLLRELGVRSVTEAADGSDALRLVRSSIAAYDVILCDIDMPVMDGFEFLKQLRSNKYIKHNDIPVLLLTSGAEERIGVREDHLRYPVDERTLSLTGIRHIYTKWAPRIWALGALEHLNATTFSRVNIGKHIN